MNVEDFTSILSDILEKVKIENKLFYICGDFNINLLNSDTHLPTANFIDVMYSASLFPFITKPTRVTEQTATLIDNIFCNDIQNSVHKNGILCNDITDHYPIFCINRGFQTTSEPRYFQIRAMTQKNKTNFIEKISNVDWSMIMRSDDARASFSAFYKIYCDLFYDCFPLQTVKAGYHNKKSWLTPGLKQSIKHKNKLYAQYRKHPSSDKEKSYKTYKTLIAKLLKKRERDHFDKMFLSYKGNLKKSWDIIKQVINRNRSKATQANFKLNGQTINDEVLIAEQFNKFFTNIGSSLSSKIQDVAVDPLSYIHCDNMSSLYLYEVSMQEVATIIQNLKNSGAGYDGIKANLLKETYESYIAPLVHVCNLSFKQGYFPDELKQAQVTPIFKAGDPTTFNNYRPISALSVFSKTFEKLMFNRVIDYFNSNKLLYQLQFGFRELHNTSTAMVYLLDKIISALSDGKFMVGIFVDLRKAFDTVNHEILLAKLYKYGIRGAVYNWFASYLSNRCQTTIFKSTASKKLRIKCGVPQGSILGPLLFIIYINDLINASGRLLPLMYADDTSLYIDGSNLHNLCLTVNYELSKIITWMRANKLSINIDKTCYIIFRPKRKHIPDNLPPISFNGRQVQKVNSIKFLGVILDDTISWVEHINSLKNKISKSIGIIAKARKYLNYSTLLTLYNSFVYPHLVYCIESWGRTSDTLLLAILRLQKKILRLIKCVPKSYESQMLFSEMKILPIKKLYLYSVALFMFKYKTGKLPSVFSDFFSSNANIYRTRGELLFKIPACTSALSQHRIRYTGVKVFNFLYDKVDRRCSLHSYKRLLKSFLLQFNDLMF